MKPYQAFLLALGIATPLWVRQLRFERTHAARFRALEREISGFFDAVVKDRDRTVKEINRAFRIGK
jgi:hypothetical protein